MATINNTIVVLCSHNGEKYLNQQILSVLNQSEPIHEFIIFDFNSTDKTVDIIKEWSLKDDRILGQYMQYAKGPCHSFFHALSYLKNRHEKTKNNIIYIIDQDDLWEHKKNEKVLEFFKKSSPDLIFHDTTIVDENLNLISNSYYTGYWDVYRDLKFPNQFFSNCVIGHTIALKQELLQKLDLNYDKRLPMHDWEIINQTIYNNGKIQFIPLALSKYRQHSNNLLGSTRKTKNALKSIIQHSKTLYHYHNFLKQHKEKNFQYLKQSNFFILKQILRNIRPLKKLILILPSFYLTLLYDKIRIFRRE
jgi:rhamnosyltransferase